MVVRLGLLHPGGFRNHTDHVAPTGWPLSILPFASSNVAKSNNIPLTNSVIVVSTLTSPTSVDAQHWTSTTPLPAFVSNHSSSSSFEDLSKTATTSSSVSVPVGYPGGETKSLQASLDPSNHGHTLPPTAAWSSEKFSITESVTSDKRISEVMTTSQTTPQQVGISSSASSVPTPKPTTNTMTSGTNLSRSIEPLASTLESEPGSTSQMTSQITTVSISQSPSSTKALNPLPVSSSSVPTTMSSPVIITLSTLISSQQSDGSWKTETLIWASLSESHGASKTSSTQVSTSSSSTSKAPPTSTQQITITSTQVETASITVAPSTITTPLSSSAISSTATPTPATTFVPVKHEVGHPSLAVLIPMTLFLILPFLLLGLFFIYRNTCPAHYAKTEPYCPIRYVGRTVAKWPWIASFLQRRERNRAIRERQRDYMTRRSRDWRWRASNSSEAPPLPVSHDTSLTSKKSFEKGVLGRTRKNTLTEKDEWLRQDMLQQYGRDRASNGPAATSTSTSPILVDSSTAMLRSPISQEEIDSYKFVPPPRSPPPPPPTGPLPPTTEEEVRNYVPGQLTGDPHYDQPQTLAGKWSLLPARTSKPDLKALVKSARDRHMATRSRSSFGDLLEDPPTNDERAVEQPIDTHQQVNTSQSLDQQANETTIEVVPPVPPRSPDREQRQFGNM